MFRNPRQLVRIALTLAAAFLILGAAPSGAALSPTDSRFGADTLVEDNASGLDWLVLPLAQGYSVGQMLSATEPGGSFEEFRFATRDELVALLDSLSIPFNGTCFGTCFTNGQQFVQLFQGNDGLLAPVMITEPDLVELFSFHVSLYPDSTEAFGDLQLVSRNPTVAFSGDRFYLVLDEINPPTTVPDEINPPTTVPEPGSLAILLGSLSWFAVFGRRAVF
jgi:hypothetical protein